METATTDRRRIQCFGRLITLPLLKGDERREERLYRKIAEGKWEPETFEAIGRFVDETTDYIDIGAWIGATAFWAAQRAGTVIAVEPDPVSFARLTAVADDNGKNIRLVQAALSDQQTVRIFAKKAFGGSSTSAVTGNPDKVVEVPGVTLLELLARCQRPVFIKVDIEGLEYRLRDMIFECGGAPIKAIQLAVHPHLHARSLKHGWLTGRLRAFRDTLRLFRDIPGYRLERPTRQRFLLLAVLRILLRRRPTGWDALYVLSRNIAGK